MTSRDARRSAPTSILKPSTSQPHPSTALKTPGAKSRGQTRGTRGTTARESEADGTRGGTRATGTRQTRYSNRSGQDGGNKPVSLFDVVKKAGEAKDDDDGGDVKADDIWNKFVSDDKDVVRAPTAESGDTELTGITGSQGSQRLSQIEEDDDDEDKEEEEEEEESSDDDRTIYSDYYLPPAYERFEGTPEIRAEIIDSHESCSCFPDRSSKFIGSMLYDKIQCAHTGLQGETQEGVYKFNPYWNENMEIPRRTRKRDLRVSKTKFVFGYPRPKFEIVSESEDDDEDEEDEDEEDGESASDAKAQTPKTAKTRGGEDEEEDDDEYDSEYDSEYDDDDEDDDEDDEDDEDYIPFELPQIGYPRTPSLPPSTSESRRSVYSEYTESIPELPPIPGSRQLTAQTAMSRRTGVTQRTQRTALPSQRQETKRSTRTAMTTKTAKTAKTEKATAKSSKKPKSETEGSIDSGYEDSRSHRSLASRQSLPTGPVIGNTRTFQGKFYDPVTKQIMLYDIASGPGERFPAGNLEPLHKPPSVDSVKPKPQTVQKSGTAPKPDSKASQRSKASEKGAIGLNAALLGNVFLTKLLSKNKQNKENVEAKFSDEEDNEG